MIVLLAKNPSPDTARLAAAFGRRGHDVLHCPSVAEATARMKRRLPDVAIVPVGEDLSALVAAARPKAGALCYLMAYLPADRPELREAAAEALLDEVVIASDSDVELERDVRLAERAADASHRLNERVAELERALAGLIASGVVSPTSPQDCQPGLMRALLSRAWKHMEQAIARMCAEYLHTEFEACSDSPPIANCRAARILLHDVDDSLEISIVVFATEPSMMALATAFCGGDSSLVDESLMQDVLSEIANSCMATLKNDFGAEGFQFTAGVPQAVSLAESSFGASRNGARRLIHSRTTDITVGFMLNLKHKAKVRVLGAHLTEGMVVASDVFSDNGLLLVKAGTRLTETTAERLARFVPKRLISQVPPGGP